jgi:predicted phage terminase large subunit-like protein
MSTSPNNPLTNDEADWLLSLSDKELEESLLTFPLELRAEILKQLMNHPTPRERAMETPADFATMASQGKWQMAKHLEYLNQAVMDTIATGGKLLVSMPPRHGKSEFLSKYLPVWYLGKFPDNRVMLITYGEKFAQKYGRMTRNLMRQFSEILGVGVSSDSASSSRWNVRGHDGGMQATGVGGQITGEGAHLLLVDDLIKNSEEAASETYREKTWDLFQSTISTRMAPKASIIVTMTRWHNDDVMGRILGQDSGDNWKYFCFPAIAEEEDQLGRQPGEALWPEMFPLSSLQKIRDQNLSLYFWNSLYQQRPSKHESVEWPETYFDGYDFWFDQWPTKVDTVVMALDPSKGKSKRSDYSAIVALARTPNGHLWVDADIKRRPIGSIIEDSAAMARRYYPSRFRVEGNGFQEILAPLIWKAMEELGIGWIPVEARDSKGDKENRIRAIDPLLRSKSIHFRNSEGGRLLVHQLKEFPMASHDDGPDALSMACKLLHELETGQIETVQPNQILPAGRFS